MLEQLFTRLNIQILKLILQKELHLRDIAAELHCSPAKVHNAITLFKQYNLVKEQPKKNMLIITPNKSSKLLQKIMELLELEK